VHRYQDVKLEIMIAVIERHLGELLDFANVALSAAS